LIPWEDGRRHDLPPDDLPDDFTEDQGDDDDEVKRCRLRRTA
jgi:hypothetical protein